MILINYVEERQNIVQSWQLYSCYIYIVDTSHFIYFISDRRPQWGILSGKGAQLEVKSFHIYYNHRGREHKPAGRTVIWHHLTTAGVKLACGRFCHGPFTRLHHFLTDFSWHYIILKKQWLQWKTWILIKRSFGQKGWRTDGHHSTSQVWKIWFFKVTVSFLSTF